MKLSLFKKSKLSRRKGLWLPLGVLVCVVLYIFGILPLIDAIKNAGEEITQKKRLLLKYDDYLLTRKSVEEELDRVSRQYEEIQEKLIPGDTPQLGAANLQEIVRRLSETNGIAIRSFRILDPKDINSLRKVSIQIDFNPTNSMLNLGQFIHDIEHHGKDLMISEMDLLVLNIRMPNNIQGSMVITGLMKGSKAKEKGKEGQGT
jgi:hypothetical protein